MVKIMRSIARFLFTIDPKFIPHKFGISEFNQENELKFKMIFVP